jgi:hypothetical protein
MVVMFCATAVARTLSLRLGQARRTSAPMRVK